MEFKHDAQKAIYGKVAGMLKEVFGEMARPREDGPAFTVHYGSAFVNVSVDAWGDDDAVVTARSWVVTEVEMVPELMHFLLRENNDFRFGAFGIDDDEDIFFEHAIVGSTCQKEELKASIMAVLRTADDYDDQITSRWGGLKASDRS